MDDFFEKNKAKIIEHYSDIKIYSDIISITIRTAISITLCFSLIFIYRSVYIARCHLSSIDVISIIIAAIFFAFLSSGMVFKTIFLFTHFFVLIFDKFFCVSGLNAIREDLSVPPSVIDMIKFFTIKSLTFFDILSNKAKFYSGSRGVVYVIAIYTLAIFLSIGITGNIVLLSILASRQIQYLSFSKNDEIFERICTNNINSVILDGIKHGFSR